MTATIQDIDVSPIRGDDVRALAVLGNALGWRVNVREGGRGVSFSHPGGDHFLLPDNDGLRQGVFVSKAKHLCRHATVKPADGWDLADEVADALKLRRSQRRQFISAVTAELGGKEKKREKPKTPDPVEAIQPPTPPPAAEPAERSIVSEGPYRRVKLTVPSKNLTIHEDSDAIIQREWSDGTIEYICSTPDCGYVSENPRSVGAHQRAHPKVDPVDLVEQPVEAEAVEPEVEPEVEETPTAEQILAQIADLVDDGRASQLRADNERLRSENERLTAEMAEVRQRADKLEGNLTVLRELMSEIGKEADG